MNLLKWLPVYLIGLAAPARSQPRPAPGCDCPRAFDAVVETLKTNYAGWADKVTPQNQAAFTRFTSRLRAQAAGATEATCFGLLARWTSHFRDHHTGIYLDYGPAPGTPYTETDTARIRAHFANWDRQPLDEAGARQYLDRNAGTLNPIEGIWRDADNTYTIAIVASRTPTRQFAGVVLKADGVYWQPGQVKMEWSAVDSLAYGGLYFMRDHSPATHYAEIKKGVLAVSRLGDWTRVYPASATKTPPAQNWNRDYSGHFELRPLDDSTLLFSLPDFDIAHKKIIDSLLTANQEKLQKTPYLVIDARSNGGGWDAAYEPILTYLYTNPILSINSNLLVTPENIRKWEGHVEDPDIPADTKAELVPMITRMKALPAGQFLKRTDDTITRPAVYAMPRRVGLLIGRNCGSSGEQFALAARQSKKVTLLGENTAGVLDYANIHDVPVPGSRFKVYYATSRTNRKQLIDNVGIAPDVRIPVSETRWIDYARNYIQQPEKK